MGVGWLWRATLVERQLAAILAADVAGCQRQTGTESNINENGRQEQCGVVNY
jgi:hypothetical protein